ncbi:fibronectin type III domain-containing protein [Paenibacillus chungangensis]|uniref:Fibronectin type III domain-containing protein n=1 Tax=Paenibacillus chungangensis TaxID=696535 RepID=A0ABW3HVM8_9BACL
MILVEGDWDWSPLPFNTVIIVDPPANVQAVNITETSATVQWTDNPGHSEYYISWGSELSTYVRDRSGPYTIENLTSNTTYIVSIYALDGTTLTSEPVEIQFTTTEAAIVWPTKEIMIGRDKGFEPTARTTRAEAAVIVKRLIDLK